MAVLCIFLVIACYFDYRKCRIPNWLLGALLMFGLGQSLLSCGAGGFLSFSVRVFLVMMLFYPLFKIGCMGAGDVKLFGICAGFLPYGKILLFLFFSLLISAIISLIRLIKKKHLQERFGYLSEYLCDVLISGHWKLYVEDMQKEVIGICLSGPILCSVLLYLGGIY